jgi:hypothetical protein
LKGGGAGTDGGQWKKNGMKREKKRDMRVRREIMRYYDIMRAKAGDRLPRRPRVWDGETKLG